MLYRPSAMKRASRAMTQINLLRAVSRSVVRGALLAMVAVAGLAMTAGGALAAAPGTNVVVNGGFETPGHRQRSTKFNRRHGARRRGCRRQTRSSSHRSATGARPRAASRSTSPGREGFPDPGDIAGQELHAQLQVQHPDRIHAARDREVGPGASPTFTETFTISADKRLGRGAAHGAGHVGFDGSFVQGRRWQQQLWRAVDDVRATELISLATPSLIRVVATGGTNAYLIGRVDGAVNTPISLQASAASVCTNGVLAAPVTTVGAPSRPDDRRRWLLPDAGQRRRRAATSSRSR